MTTPHKADLQVLRTIDENTHPEETIKVILSRHIKSVMIPVNTNDLVILTLKIAHMPACNVLVVPFVTLVH